VTKEPIEEPASTLRHLLENVHGPLPLEAQAGLASADLTTIQGWTERFLVGKALLKAVASLFSHALEQRFGPLPSAAAERHLSAGVHTLRLWAERYVTATSIEGVLGTSPSVCPSSFVTKDESGT